ncbi:MAG: 1-(5-phosphoribosyl)-5-[(5-phosphoribosylamino)methylideneamino]imidazole-4-carboxamide isomerase [Candidatus Aadella gelida]|nr:1-(5-phosphoribosyl)-5-[(5-phosphoribosylamino)methylideneamino]imidazole-4-carboxamide isomerase [Candidatus Aadella gelida]
MKIIPAIDLINGKTVRLEQGKYDRKLSYDIDPVDAARKWKSMGAELLHVIDLDGAKEGKPVNLNVVEKIVKEVGVPVEVGGGFRNTGDIQKAIDIGAFRVIIGSRAFEDRSFVGKCMKEFGDKVIFSVDVIDLKASVHGWMETIDDDIYKKLLPFFLSNGVKEMIYTDIKSDGMLSGPNIEALKSIFEHVDLKIVSAGGIKDIEHIRQLKKIEAKPGQSRGVSGVIIGRALYEGTIDLKEAIDVSKENNTVS